MPEAKKINPRTLEKLTGVFKVEQEICTDYNQIYESTILPKIHEKYLAHLVASVEDLITQKTNAVKAIPGGYRICIVQHELRKAQAKTFTLAQCATIWYKFDEKDLKNSRIIIAHELGHLLVQHKILPGNNTQNNANLFAYFAINGKNIFYNEQAPELIYQGGETEIIDKIQRQNPINTPDQPDPLYQKGIKN